MSDTPIKNTDYFYRTAVFTRQGGKVALIDINNPVDTTPLEEWMGTVLSLADGKHTVQQLIDYMAGQYLQAPENLEETLHSVIDRLKEGLLLQLSPKQVDLPYYLELPFEQLDIAKAKLLMKDEEFIRH